MKKQLTSQTAMVAGLILLGVIVATIGYLAAVAPQRSKSDGLATQIRNAQEQVVALRLGGPRAKALHAAELFQLARAMPTSDDMPGIVLELARLAQASKVTIVSIRPSPRVAQPDGSSTVPVALAVSGSYSGLSSFLRLARQQVLVGSKLHVGGRLFLADQLTLTAAAATAAGTPGAPAGELQATLNLVAFDYGAPPSPSSTAGVGPGSSTTTTGTTTTTPAPPAPSGSSAAPANPATGAN